MVHTPEAGRRLRHWREVEGSRRPRGELRVHRRGLRVVSSVLFSQWREKARLLQAGVVFLLENRADDCPGTATTTLLPTRPAPASPSVLKRSRPVNVARRGTASRARAGTASFRATRATSLAGSRRMRSSRSRARLARTCLDWSRIKRWVVVRENRFRLAKLTHRRRRSPLSSSPSLATCSTTPTLASRTRSSPLPT